MVQMSLGLIETIGLTAAIEAADVAVKTANVRLVGYELTRGAGMTTVKIEGDVGAVKAAVSAAEAAAAKVGKVVGAHVIPRPACGLETMIRNGETVGEEPAADSSDENGGDAEPTEEKPTEPAEAEKPAQLAAEAPAEPAAAEKPAQLAAEAPTEPAAEKTPAEPTEETPVESAEEKPTESVEAETPAQLAVKTPAEPTEETPVESAAEKPAEPAEAKKPKTRARGTKGTRKGRGARTMPKPEKAPPKPDDPME
jgi:microcompartment protein CcmL/EutN